VDACFVVRIVGHLLRVQGTPLGAVNGETIASWPIAADSSEQLQQASAPGMEIRLTFSGRFILRLLPERR
jgi:hypothetical protein